MRITDTNTEDDVERAYRAEIASGRSPDQAYVVVSNDLHEGLRDQRITPVQWRRLRRRLEGA